MFKFQKKIIKFFALIIILIVAGAFFLTRGDKNIETRTVNFKIEKGDSIWVIGKKLKKERLIDNQFSFIFEVYKKGKEKKIKAGEYLLNSKLNVDEIIELVANGNIIEKNNQKKLTFPEGWTTKQMAELLNKEGFSGNEFLKMTKEPKYFQEKYSYSFLDNIPKNKSLEGFLFPDTYFFANNTDSEIIIKKMLDNFNKKLSEDLRQEIKKQQKTIYEIVTMASIIEEEVKNTEDKKIVSGIFWRRLKRGQAFQSCATLAYILGENKKQYSYEDTKIESPYNTYLYPGLPPGPISNPGLDSILAAIYPTKTNYNYFLNNPKTGKTIFSRTLEEHNLNKTKNGL
ncbi:MAG TPA: endolytic transglycosylase MltG [Candidatus Moranbacteria bacterium]|nr:endolytic transglycosylase MltG [Candidatus Moranbacteria bacterium]